MNYNEALNQGKVVLKRTFTRSTSKNVRMVFQQVLPREQSNTTYSPLAEALGMDQLRPRVLTAILTASPEFIDTHGLEANYEYDKGDTVVVADELFTSAVAIQVTETHQKDPANPAGPKMVDDKFVTSNGKKVYVYTRLVDASTVNNVLLPSDPRSEWIPTKEVLDQVLAEMQDGEEDKF